MALHAVDASRAQPRAARPRKRDIGLQGAAASAGAHEARWARRSKESSGSSGAPRRPRAARSTSGAGARRGRRSQPASSSAVARSTLGYLEESDRSRWAEARLAELLENVEVDLGQGACVAITTCLTNESSVSASVTRKRGQRSLYYDIDVKCAWRAPGAARFS